VRILNGLFTDEMKFAMGCGLDGPLLTEFNRIFLRLWLIKFCF